MTDQEIASALSELERMAEQEIIDRNWGSAIEVIFDNVKEKRPEAYSTFMNAGL